MALLHIASQGWVHAFFAYISLVRARHVVILMATFSYEATDFMLCGRLESLLITLYDQCCERCKAIPFVNQTMIICCKCNTFVTVYVYAQKEQVVSASTQLMLWVCKSQCDVGEACLFKFPES